jgi:hypothetical protein
MEKYSGTPDFDRQALHIKQAAAQTFGGKYMRLSLVSHCTLTYFSFSRS